MQLKKQLIQNSNLCLEWQGAKDQYGYGLINLNGTRRVHRVMWILHHGSIPSGMYICHSCDNPACANIEHLFLGTPKDNALDMVTKERSWNQKKTHCPKGHPYNEENTYFSKQPYRGTWGRCCKICLKERNRAKRNQIQKQSPKASPPDLKPVV